MKPKIEDIDAEYKMHLTLTDHNEEPASKRYDFTVKVIAPDDIEDFEQSQNVTLVVSKDKERIQVRVSDISSDGYFDVMFN